MGGSRESGRPRIRWRDVVEIAHTVAYIEGKYYDMGKRVVT